MAESSTHNHVTILNVDDNEALAYARTRILTQAGYSVAEAWSGEEGLKLLPLLNPQLLVLDVNLPGIDGLEVCRKVKSDPATQHVMVLQVSMARGTSLDRAAGLDGGADAYLVEPIEPVELIATVRALLRLASREMDNRRLIQQLRRIERQFADATEAAECGLWDWDIVNGKLEWFGVHDRLAGMSPGKFSGQIDEFSEILHPDDRERVRRTLHETMARREERYVDEYRFVYPDGSVHWMLGTGRFIYNEQGPIRMTGIVRDVTERKQIEIALCDSEERLQHAAESLSLAQRASMSGVWDWNITKGDIYVSPEYRRLFGFSDYEPVPFNRWLEAVHEEDRSAVEADERKLLESGIDWSVEFRIVHPERGLRWLASIGRLERDDAGRPRRFSGVTLDITDRKQTERRTRLMATETLSATAKFRAVFDQSAMFAVVMSLDGIVLEANHACLDVCGYHAKEVLRRSFWKTLWWRGSHEVQAKIQAGALQAAQGMIYREELPYWWADGTEHLVDFSLHPIWNEQGAVMFLYSTGVDITERKRRESNLAFLADLQGAFSRLASVEEITQLVTEKIVAYLGLSRCLLVELSETAEQSKVLYEHANNERSRFVDVNSIKDLHTEDELRRLFAGHTVIINDVRHEPRPEDTSRLMALEAGALASAPYVSHGRWTLVLSVIHHAPHRWRADETELLTELAWRTYFRLERARTEEALRVSEQEFRSLAEAVPQLVWAARPDGWNIYFNQQWLNYTGLTPEESYGYGWDTLFHADDDQRAQEAWQRANQRREPYELECRLRRADGVYRWWLVRGIPIFNANGMIQKWFGTCTDIEDLKQVEQTLQENAKRLSLALEAGQMGAWDVDLRTHRIRWDDKTYALLGLERGSIESSLQEFYRCVHPDDRRMVKRLVDHGLDTERAEQEIRVVHPNGEVRWLAVRRHTFLDDEGLPSRIVGVFFDVTDRRCVEEQFRSLAGQLERLVDERTQELVQSQTRLRLLATELNLAEQRERKRLAGELHDYLAQLLVLGCLKLGQLRRTHLPSKAGETVKEVEELLTQSLDYSRTLMAELSPPVLQEHGLSAGLKWLGEQMQRYGLRVKVTVSGAPDVSLPNDCAVLLFQSVRELVMNALKHAGCQEVVIRLQQEGRRLSIEVRDDGVGFDLAAATSMTSMSSKLGLLSIRERMTSLGGWFDLQSAPGEGTTAMLALLLGGGATAGSELNVLSSEFIPDLKRLTQDSQLYQQSAKIRILLVDDHAMVRQGLRSVLDSYPDIEVVGEAWNGEVALATVEILHPAVVLMDVNMPKMNGIEATAAIKARYPEIVVIGLSVNPGGENETAMMQAGAAVLLTKEAAVDELYREVQEALKGR